MGRFYGWYLKQRGRDGTVAVIPSVSEYEGRLTGNIQIITQDGSFEFTHERAVLDRKNGFMIIGQSCFTKEGFTMKAEGAACAFGNVRFGPLTPLPQDIMGPFALLGDMECRHMVMSMSHETSGYINIGEKGYDFNGGRGYFEGDCGRSFPQSYVWTQGSCGQSAVMMAAASIPIANSSFTGVICAIKHHDRLYRLATYNGARLVYADEKGICIRRGETELSAFCLKARPHALKAPVEGMLERTIYESPACPVRYVLKVRGCVLMDFTDEQAGYECAVKK